MRGVKPRLWAKQLARTQLAQCHHKDNHGKQHDAQLYRTRATQLRTAGWSAGTPTSGSHYLPQSRIAENASQMSQPVMHHVRNTAMKPKKL